MKTVVRAAVGSTTVSADQVYFDSWASHPLQGQTAKTAVRVRFGAYEISELNSEISC